MGFVYNQTKTSTAKFMTMAAPGKASHLEQIELEHSRVVIYAHKKDRCIGNVCPLHQRTDHPLRWCPQYWDSINKRLTRLCLHNTHHLDPDDLFTIETLEIPCPCGCQCCAHQPTESRLPVCYHTDLEIVS